jgi:hypothetical protein
VKSPKNFFLVLFALATLGIGALAWQQHQELIKLRAEVLNGEDRASMEKRLAAAEKRARDLESQLAALRGQGGDDAESMAAAATDGNGDANGNRPGRGNRNQAQFAAIRALMDKPEVQALMAVQQKAALATRYAALFKSLGLSPDQADKVMGLLAQKQTALQDVMAAAREQGINPRTDPTGFGQLVSSAQADINSSLKSTLGDAGFAQLQQYDQTMPQRNVVNQLQQSLSYTSSPLTDAQTDQLIQILASNAPQRQNGAAATDAGGFGGGFRAAFGGGGPGGGGFGGGGGGATITPNAVIQAQTVLSTTQVQALQQLQQTQQAQQQMQQLIRQTITGQGGNGGTRSKGGG